MCSFLEDVKFKQVFLKLNYTFLVLNYFYYTIKVLFFQSWSFDFCQLQTGQMGYDTSGCGSAAGSQNGVSGQHMIPGSAAAAAAAAAALAQYGGYQAQVSSYPLQSWHSVVPQYTVMQPPHMSQVEVSIIYNFSIIFNVLC